MKLATWNVNSIKARKDRALSWLEQHQPDVLCIQELKVEDKGFPKSEVEALGYHCAIHGQKTYNGVAILSRTPPEEVTQGLGDGVDDTHARLISAKVDGVRILSAYFPNGQEVGSDKFAYKLEWMKRLRAYLDTHCDAHADEVALCGDFNVAPFDDDIARLKEFQGGVLACDEVRDALAAIRDFGLVDVFRPFHPDGRVYSWWDYRGGGFERGNGLRIDHVYATARLARRSIGAIVDREERKGKLPSDHAPVVVEFGS